MRKISDIHEKEMPSVGKHNCIITSADMGESKNKKTPYLELTMTNGEVEFSDCLFLTPKALNRLLMVSKRVCNINEETELPDNDMEACRFLANYIQDNIIGKHASITIAEFEEKFIPESGQDMGRMKTIFKRKVAFNGYEGVKNNETPNEIKIYELPPSKNGLDNFF
jgi:hypothetical protein